MEHHYRFTHSDLIHSWAQTLADILEQLDRERLEELNRSDAE